MKNSFFDTFKHFKSFAILLVGQSVSQLGTAMTSFAILIWVYTQNNAVTAVAMLSVCSIVPYIIVSVIGGAIADRISKKKIMLICDLVAAIGSLAILICLMTGSLELWHLYILNVASGKGCFLSNFVFWIIQFHRFNLFSGVIGFIVCLIVQNNKHVKSLNINLD